MISEKRYTKQYAAVLENSPSAYPGTQFAFERLHIAAIYVLCLVAAAYCSTRGRTIPIAARTHHGSHEANYDLPTPCLFLITRATHIGLQAQSNSRKRKRHHLDHISRTKIKTTTRTAHHTSKTHPQPMTTPMPAIAQSSGSSSCVSQFRLTDILNLLVWFSARSF